MEIVYMIGHGDLKWSAFVGLLRRHGIERLVDVRSIATSRYPQFNEGFLKRTLPRGAYQHWAGLGGHQMFGAQAVRSALEQVLDRASETRTVLLCSEADFRQCHRYTRLTPIALQLNWRVLEIRHGGQLIEIKKGPRCHPEAHALPLEARSKSTRWRPITPPVRLRATLSD